MNDPVHAERTFPWLNFTTLIVITYSVLWLSHDYLAFFMSLLIPLLALFILLISLVIEYLEKSNVPRWYYKLMFLLIILPLLTGLIFAGIKKFEFDWRVLQ